MQLRSPNRSFANRRRRRLVSTPQLLSVSNQNQGRNSRHGHRTSHAQDDISRSTLGALARPQQGRPIGFNSARTARCEVAYTAVGTCGTPEPSCGAAQGDAADGAAPAPTNGNSVQRHRADGESAETAPEDANEVTRSGHACTDGTRHLPNDLKIRSSGFGHQHQGSRRWSSCRRRSSDWRC
jgi:hypothetical protein